MKKTDEGHYGTSPLSSISWSAGMCSMHIFTSHWWWGYLVSASIRFSIWMTGWYPRGSRTEVSSQQQGAAAIPPCTTTTHVNPGMLSVQLVDNEHRGKWSFQVLDLRWDPGSAPSPPVTHRYTWSLFQISILQTPLCHHREGESLVSWCLTDAHLQYLTDWQWLFYRAVVIKILQYLLCHLRLHNSSFWVKPQWQEEKLASLVLNSLIVTIYQFTA